MKHSPIDYGAATLVPKSTAPDRSHHWRDVVAHCEALNARDGTDKVSPNMIKNRRKRAKERERAEADSADGPSMVDTIGKEYRANAKAMQDEMDGAGFGPEPEGRGR